MSLSTLSKVTGVSKELKPSTYANRPLKLKSHFIGQSLPTKSLSFSVLLHLLTMHVKYFSPLSFENKFRDIVITEQVKQKLTQIQMLQQNNIHLHQVKTQLRALEEAQAVRVECKSSFPSPQVLLTSLQLWFLKGVIHSPLGVSAITTQKSGMSSSI